MTRVMSLEERARQIASYQFGVPLAQALIDGSTEVKTNTRGKIRYLFKKGKHLATLRPTTGKYTLSTVAVANLSPDIVAAIPLTVTISADIEPDFKPGMTLFAKHVKHANPEIRPSDEVLVITPNKKVICAGRAILSGGEMNDAKTGVAVRTRN